MTTISKRLSARNGGAPVHWTFNSRKDQISLHRRFIQEYIDRDRESTRRSRLASERYILGEYLRDWLRPTEYPIIIEDRCETNESPDCIIHLAGEKNIGLELTEATNQHYRNEMAAKVKPQPGESWLTEVDHIRGDVRIIEKHHENGEIIIVDPRGYTGAPWIGGYQGEDIEADTIMQAIQKKSEKAKSWANGFHECQVAIMVNATVHSRHGDLVCRMVLERLAGRELEILFDAIFLIDPMKNSKFPYFIAKERGKFKLKRARRVRVASPPLHPASKDKGGELKVNEHPASNRGGASSESPA